MASINQESSSGGDDALVENELYARAGSGFGQRDRKGYSSTAVHSEPDVIGLIYRKEIKNGSFRIVGGLSLDFGLKWKVGYSHVEKDKVSLIF